MNKELTKEDIKNILQLISLASIQAKDALPVALLQQKLNIILEDEPKMEVEKTVEKDSTEADK